MTITRTFKEELVENVAISQNKREIMELTIDITRAIHRAVGGGGIKNLCVHLIDGKLILSGHCRKFFTKQVAQEVAMEAYLEGSIINDIKVI